MLIALIFTSGVSMGFEMVVRESEATRGNLADIINNQKRPHRQLAWPVKRCYRRLQLAPRRLDQSVHSALINIHGRREV